MFITFFQGRISWNSFVVFEKKSTKKTRLFWTNSSKKSKIQTNNKEMRTILIHRIFLDKLIFYFDVTKYQ